MTCKSQVLTLFYYIYHLKLQFFHTNHLKNQLITTKTSKIEFCLLAIIPGYYLIRWNVKKVDLGRFHSSFFGGSDISIKKHQKHQKHQKTILITPKSLHQEIPLHQIKPSTRTYFSLSRGKIRNLFLPPIKIDLRDHKNQKFENF